MLSEYQNSGLPLSLTTSHPARRATDSPLALTLVESRVELLPTLLSTADSVVGQWSGSKMRVSTSYKSFSLKERG
jgi:hypothetical protein